MLLYQWGFPGKNTGVGCNFPLQGILQTQGLNLPLLHWQADSLRLSHQGSPSQSVKVKVRSLSRVRLFETPWVVVYQAPLFMGFSRQGYWNALPFLSPIQGSNPGLPHCRQTLILSELPGKPLSMCIEMQIPDALKSKNSFIQFWHLFWGDNPLVLAHPVGIRDGYLYLKYICLHFWPCCLIEK